MTNPHGRPNREPPAVSGSRHEPHSVWGGPAGYSPASVGHRPAPSAPAYPLYSPCGQPPAGGRASPPKPAESRRFRPRDPLSVVLIIVIVVAVMAAALLAGELYARHRVDNMVTARIECAVHDNASVSFGPTPLLLQFLTGHFSEISIHTAGNQIRNAKGMKVDVDISDVRLHDNATSRGTIGSLEAMITWSADGIRQSLQTAIPLLGDFVTGVKTNPSTGTIELDGGLGSLIAKPQIVNGGLSLQVVGLSGPVLRPLSDMVQRMLDAFTTALTDNYPWGIRADSVLVTNDGVVSQLSTNNVSIPRRSSGTPDPCSASGSMR